MSLRIELALSTFFMKPVLLIELDLTAEAGVEVASFPVRIYGDLWAFMDILGSLTTTSWYI